jgi:ribokinase
MRDRVFCLGSINADITLRLDRLPLEHEKLAAREVALGGGGCAANTAVWIARQGAPTAMLGWVGDDPLGDMALRDLAAEGVDTAGVARLRAPSPVAVCLATPDGKRIVTSPIIDAPWRPDDAAAHLAANAWLHTTVRDVAFLTRVRAAHAPVLSVELDGAYDPRLASVADYIFTNADELSRATGSEDVGAFVAKTHGADRATWFVTRGARGALAIARGRIDTVSGPVVAPVDRTGGGDAFDAGVVVALFGGADALTAAAAGLKLAARAITRLGAR